jgi:PAS domain S-box-containing protein
VTPRAARLQTLTARLSRALTPADVARAVLEDGLPALNSTAGSVALLEGEELVLTGVIGFDAELAKPWQRFPVTAPAPIPEAVRTRQSVWVETPDDFRVRYGRPPEVGVLEVSRAWVAVPLLVGDTVYGALGASYPEERSFDDADRRYAETLAHVCAQALERARLYSELERQARAFHITLSTLEDYVYTFDREARFVYANRALLELWGLSLEAAMLKTMTDLAYPEEVEISLRDGVREVFETGRVVRSETFYTTPAGTNGYFENVLAPVLGDDGRVAFVTGSSRDVTARKRRELNAELTAALSRDLERASGEAEIARLVAERVAQHLEATHAVFLEIDEDQRGLRVLHEWRAPDAPSLFGAYRLEAWVAEPFLSELNAGRAVVVDEVGAHAVTRHAAEGYATLGIGALVWVPYRSDDRLRFLLAVTDAQTRDWREDELELLTDVAARVWTRVERARSEIALRDSEARLRAANEAQRRFVSDAAHELRAPLTSIRGNLELLLRHTDASLEQRLEMTRDAEREAGRLARLVSDLLSLARGEAGQQGEFAPIRFDHLVAECARGAGHFAARRTVRLEAMPVVVVQGDRDALKQLVLILLENALKYTHANARVDVRVTLEGERVRLIVEDDGPGIAKEDLERVFERFYRVDRGRTPSSDPGGTGLGLPIARQIAARHGGTVHLESEVGVGTTAVVRLPLVMDGHGSQ